MNNLEINFYFEKIIFLLLLILPLDPQQKSYISFNK